MESFISPAIVVTRLYVISPFCFKYSFITSIIMSQPYHYFNYYSYSLFILTISTSTIYFELSNYAFSKLQIRAQVSLFIIIGLSTSARRYSYPSMLTSHLYLLNLLEICLYLSLSGNIKFLLFKWVGLIFKCIL